MLTNNNSPKDSSAESIYQHQLESKRILTTQEFSEFGVHTLETFASTPQNYRMRAEFKAWHKNGQIHYGMFGGEKNRSVYALEEFSPGSATMQTLMMPLLAEINANELLGKKLFQVEFLTSSQNDAVITLIYHKPLTDAWLEAATKLSQLLLTPIVGRSRKQRLIISRDYVEEKFTVAQRPFIYHQLEGAFTQPNANVCEKMLNWAAKNTKTLGGDLLELYCGNGNFTLPLSQNFRQVLATEIAKSSIDSALKNCQLNNIKNINFVRMSSEDISGAFNKVREYKRLKHLALDSYNFSTVFVDPPRAGIDSATLEFMQRFANILYISCNPFTLKQNLQQLTNSHQVVKMALFDQFPYTEHRECGVLLSKIQ
jgi:tRNA (uracil-5-)-methyltransferase